MKAIYRTHFEVRARQASQGIPDALANICWQWLLNPKRGYSLPAPAPTGCMALPRTEVGKSGYAEAMVLEDDGSSRWALALSHTDHDDPAVLWRTELGVLRLPSDQVFFSCSLYLGRTDSSLAPIRHAVSRPRVVLDVLKQFTGHGALPMTSRPLLLKPDPSYIEAFLRLLCEERRQHPVVFVSVHEQSGGYFFDVKRLADHLAGTAYVVASQSLDACHLLQEQLPAEYGATDGAVRLYWPGFGDNSDPFDHPRWTKSRILAIQARSQDAFSKKLLADIAAVASASVPEQMLTWAKMEEATRHHAIAQARAAQDELGMARLFEQDNADLRLRIAGLEAELKAKAEALFKAQRSLSDLTSAQAQPTADAPLPRVSSVAEAIEVAATRWPAELVFQPNNKSEDDSPFQPAQEVLCALRWLATTYYGAKLGKAKCADLDHNLREKLPGWSYSPHQSDTSSTTYAEWYQCTWEGRKYDITPHIGRGSSTRPEETIRIGFAWDKPRKKVVIGYVGQHQKNTKS